MTREFIKVGTTGDFREDRPRAVDVGDRKAAVFRIGGRLYAVQDWCPHMGASLSEAQVEGVEIVCHWHGWRFDLVSGAGLPPSKRWACLRVYDVKIEGDSVYLRPPEEPRPGEEEPWVAWDEDRFLRKGAGSDRLTNGDVGTGETDGQPDGEDETDQGR